MPNINQEILQLDVSKSVDKFKLTDQISDLLTSHGYTIFERNDTKPWGAYLRLNNSDAADFINNFFLDSFQLSAQEGNSAVELSPKILIVSPGQKLSWQYHSRRAEQWVFLNSGAYHQSPNNHLGAKLYAQPGQLVRFNQGERHRLVGVFDSYTLVAEIWQHTDPANPSDEDDIVRLEDDYTR